ncbi:MAG: hypothetical protein OXE44_00755 [Nitrospinae bacterium]|nr:hypothetical protein [Nitrospinota bacterium]
MPTNVFAIALTTPNQSVENLIERNLKGFYRYNDTLYFVHTDGIAENLAVLVGLKGENRIPDSSGFVLKMDGYTYSGYTSRSLWDWFREVEKMS